MATTFCARVNMRARPLCCELCAERMHSELCAERMHMRVCVVYVIRGVGSVCTTDVYVLLSGGGVTTLCRFFS